MYNDKSGSSILLREYYIRIILFRNYALAFDGSLRRSYAGDGHAER